jgi:hypothetical protein
MTSYKRSLHVGFIVCAAVLILIGTADIRPTVEPVLAQDGGECPALVTGAIRIMGSACGPMGRNEACYGHTRVSATFQPEAAAAKFDTIGDRVQLIDLQALVTDPADPAVGTWGAAMLKVEANLAEGGTDVLTLVLFGETEVTNAVEPGQANITTCTITNTGSNINVRSGPGTGYAVVDVLARGDTATANGRNAAGDWVRIQRGEATGWAYVPLVTVDCPVETLAEVEADAPGTLYTRPMQAFTLQSGDGSLCEESPDGLLIDSPAGRRARVMVNGIQLEFASAGFLQATPNGNFMLTGLDGSIDVTAAGQTVTVIPGFFTTVPLSGLDAAGPPTPPQPVPEGGLGTLPGLRRAVVEGEPLDFETAGDLIPGISSGVVATSGTYTETYTHMAERLVGDCYWVDSNQSHLYVGQPISYSVTIQVSVDGSSLTYTDPSGEPVTLTRTSGTTYTGSHVFGESALNNFSVTFTSPTTYVNSMTYEVLSGRCAGMTGSGQGTGTMTGAK